MAPVLLFVLLGLLPYGLRNMAFIKSLALEPFRRELFKKNYLFLDRGRRRKKEREKNINVQEKHRLVASHTPPTGDLDHNPGMCPDWELNH